MTLKDLRGISIEPGDIILLGNNVMLVKEISNAVIQTNVYAGAPNTPIALPGKLLCEVEINIDFTKPLAGFKLVKDNHDKAIDN